MATTVDQDLQELKRLIRGAAAGKAATDSTPHAGISLTRTEQQNLRFKRPPAAMDSSKPGTVQRGDSRLKQGPVSGFYRHPGTNALDSADTRSALEKEQDAIEPDVNDAIADNDPEIAQLVEAIKDVPPNVSKTALQATTRNGNGTLQVGQAEYNARHGRRVAQYS